MDNIGAAAGLWFGLDWMMVGLAGYLTEQASIISGSNLKYNFSTGRHRTTCNSQ
jgi:hypothetical protein